MDIKLDERVIEEIIELREDNQRLHNMCVIMEQIGDILTPIVNECKCHTIMNSKIKTKLNILTHKYKQLKDITNCVFNHNHKSSNNSHKQKLIEKLKKCSKITPKKLKINRKCSETNSDHNYKIENKLIECKNELEDNKRDLKAGEESGVSGVYGCDWPGCDKVFKNQSNLNGHRDIHLEVKRFRCDWPGCEQMFLRKGQFESHMSSHTNDKRFKCDWPGCGYQSCRTDKLKIHKRVHTGEKPYICDWPGCEFASSYEKGLQRHKMRHTGEKPYRCEWPSCNWTFRQLTHLKAHLLKHTGEKPFECEFMGCGRKFSSRQAMRFHLEKSHKN